MRFPFKHALKKNSAPEQSHVGRLGTTFKRTAVVGALSLASVLAVVSPAGATTDIRGSEPFNTDRLLMSLCTGSSDRTYWFINVQTGEITRDTTNGIPADRLPAPIERFEGWCSYPESSSWTWTGSEQRATNLLVNCSQGTQLSQNIQMNGSTTSTTSNSVGGSVGVSWTAIEKVLEFQAGANYQRTWSYAKQSGWSTTTGIVVSPRRVGWMALRPVMRTVRSNPVFHVERYSWGRQGGGQTNTTTWRGRGFNTINSRGAYYDAVGNVLDNSGKPTGQYVARDRAVTGSDC